MSTLRIYGDIGEFSPDGMEAISARMVADFLEQTADDQVTVRINSRGGDVQEGWAIHDLLVNSGKKIKTIGEGKVYSIATIIFLAGDEREMMKNADGLIHNPYIPPFTLADAYESSDLHKIAAELEQEEQKILAFYVERTGSPVETLSEYMKNDTKLSAEDMLKLGFATKVIEPVRAYAYMKTNLTHMNEKAFFERLGEALDGAVAKIKNLSRLPQVDQTLTDKDGNEFTVVRETGSPEVGDKANPDGTYTMADGTVITVADGTITEVKEAEAPDELADAKETIATLEAKITELETAQAAKVEEIAAKEAEVTAKEAEAAKVVSEAQALVTELSALKNEWKPEGRSKMNTVVDKVGSVDLARVKEIRKKLTEKSE